MIEAVTRGYALYRAGLAFAAHEAFEDAWRVAEGDTKAALQALVQVCAARHKAAQGNLRGTEKLLAKAQANLQRAPAPDAALRLDRGATLAEVTRALAEARAGALATPPALVERVDEGEAGVVYLHGFASSPASHKAHVIVPRLRAAGIPVRVPDLNAGGFAHLTVSRALDQVRAQLFERTLIVGSSLGGYLAALLQRQDARVVALVLMAPAFDLSARLAARYGPEALDAWRAEGAAEVEHHTYGGGHRIGYGLFEDAARHPGRPRPTVPTYVLQGARDDVVPVEMVREVFAGGAATLDVVDDDHGLAASAGRAADAALDLWSRVQAARD